MKSQARPAHWLCLYCALALYLSVFWSAQALAQQSDVLTTIADRYVKECALHLALPADWTIKAQHTDDGCNIDALGPKQANLCGTLGNDPTDPGPIVCDDEKKLRIEIRAGSIAELTKAGHDSPT